MPEIEGELEGFQDQASIGLVFLKMILRKTILWRSSVRNIPKIMKRVHEGMESRLNLAHKIGQGISPQQFMDHMQIRSMELSNIPNTKDLFFSVYDNFAWTHEDKKAFYTALNNRSDLHCLILCTDWCPDVIWNVPILFRVMEQCHISTEVLLMEEHMETMDLFLTDGGRAQPIAVFLNGSGDVLGRWGARPAYIQAVMERFKKNNPNKQEPDYKEKLNQIYREIGEIYHTGNEYQGVILHELKDLFTTFPS
ncbi:thioredoxin family protein [Paenibacillus sp. GCM10023248]|uniref:thioredoxin family protein n=2 Tax=Bacillales TaxID=1385 RepID=UPI00286B1418|nr:thioredoxin family protein [Bacillus sp. 3255]MDD9269695.1 thioredoxin family protein [Paenibacillus sp. MAHUQ-63]